MVGDIETRGYALRLGRFRPNVARSVKDKYSGGPGGGGKLGKGVTRLSVSGRSW